MGTKIKNQMRYKLLGFVLVVVMSVICANFIETNSSISWFAGSFVKFVQPVIPWIDNYRVARSSWGLSDTQTLKTESITVLWFLFGAILTVLGILRVTLITSEQRAQVFKYADDSVSESQKPQSGTFVFFAVLFALYMAAAELNGWLDLDNNLSKCIMAARCYSQDDLLIIGAAGMKCFAIFGFPSGAVLMVRQFFKQRS